MTCSGRVDRRNPGGFDIEVSYRQSRRQPRTLDRLTQPLATTFQPARAAARKPATRLGKVCTSIGLAMYPAHPAANAFSRSPGIAYAVRTSTGLESDSGLLLCRRVSESPSCPGNWTSMRMRTG